MIEFKLGEHTISRGNAMIEIWRDGVFVAGIFPPVPAAIVQFAAPAK
jgi:hypothetical protein